MHVGVEETVAEDLGEEDFDAGLRQLLQVDASARRRSICEIGKPFMRSMTITVEVQKSQCTRAR